MLRSHVLFSPLYMHSCRIVFLNSAHSSVTQYAALHQVITQGLIITCVRVMLVEQYHYQQHVVDILVEGLNTSVVLYLFYLVWNLVDEIR